MKIVKTYTIPESMRYEGGPTTLGLKELTADEEIMATNIGGNSQLAQAYEMLKLMIAEFDGKPVSAANEDVMKFWEKAPAKIRKELMEVWKKIHIPDDKEHQSFMGSEQTKIS